MPALVQLEANFVVLPERWILLLLAQHGIADHQAFDVGAHEAAEGVLGRAHNRLAAHVEGGIDEHGTAGETVELLDQGVIGRVGVAMPVWMRAE